MNINTDKIYLARIMPVGEKTRHSKYRTAENGYSDEFHRLVEDEVFAIIKTGKGFCFNEKQFEAIKEKLKDKLSIKEYESIKYKNEDGCFIISFKRTRKKYTRKQDLVLA